MMKIRIEDLINTPELRTRVVTGQHNIQNIVQWAHVCEMSDPTEWLGQHDLLMTTGLGIPHAPDAQTLYIERLVEAKLSGLMIGENMQAPADLSSLLKCADLHQFPVLFTHYGVPFAAITKMITDSRHQFEFERNRAVANLYEHARQGLNGLDTPALIQKLNKALNIQIHLVHLEQYQLIFSDQAMLDNDTIEHLKTLQSKRMSPHSLVKKIEISEYESLYLLATSFYDYHLLIRAKELDFSLIHHIASILSIDLERKNYEFQRKLRTGSELFDDILEQRVTSHQLEHRLEEYGLSLSNSCVMVADISDQCHFEAFLFVHHITAIVKKHADHDVFLLNDNDIESLTPILLKAGISHHLSYVERFSSALQEAKLAYKHSEPKHALQYYQDIRDALPWLPKDINEAKQIFERYLGALEKLDQSQGTSHLVTLKCFLEHNCAWEKTAKALYIHKQTLVYRIQKIQNITGRNLNQTEDIVVLWLALKCQDIVNTL